MARSKAARRMAAQNVTDSSGAPLGPARPEASRKNGAKSKGPKTPEGEARSARNALKHALRAETPPVVGNEDPQEFAAFEATLMADLAPDGVLQTTLASQVVYAAWRLERADRIEAELLTHEREGVSGEEGDRDLALLHDSNGAFDMLLRYRASAQAEFFRMLRLLQELQAETASQQAHRHPNQPEARASESPIEPESRSKPGKSPATAADRTDARAILLDAKRISKTIH
jgi:hypothetical protein